MKKPLKPEDIILWEAITKGVNPLRSQRAPSVSSALAPVKKENESVINRTSEKKAPAAKRLQELGHGLGIERRQGRQLRRADRPYDRLIDLHGMTQMEAHDALIRFIHQSRARGDRCVLIITGKGGTSGGVLRREVPRWLNEPDLRAGILAFDHAAPKHGGEGALYLLLKKKN